MVISLATACNTIATIIRPKHTSAMAVSVKLWVLNQQVGQETFTQLRRGLQRREGEEQIQGQREKEKDREDKDDLKQKRSCNL